MGLHQPGATFQPTAYVGSVIKETGYMYSEASIIYTYIHLFGHMLRNQFTFIPTMLFTDLEIQLYRQSAQPWNGGVWISEAPLYIIYDRFDIEKSQSCSTSLAFFTFRHLCLLYSEVFPQITLIMILIPTKLTLYH